MRSAAAAHSAPREPPIGTLTLRDILRVARGPAATARGSAASGIQARHHQAGRLAPGMELTGTVLNVVDFGCFVDIGMHDSGLVHVSRLADRFIRDPHEVVAVGDIVTSG